MWLLFMMSVMTACFPIQAVGTEENGFVEGHVTVGPLQPVENTGAPSPTPAPAVYAKRALRVFAADGTTFVTEVRLQPTGTYRVALPPGIYVVDMAPVGMDAAANLPARVTIRSGESVRLDVAIDTGIR